MRAMLLLGLIGGSTVAANAQRAETLLKPGARVRVTQSASHLVKEEGTVVERRGDSLAVKLSYRDAFNASLSYRVVTLKLLEIDSLSVATFRRGAGNWKAGAAVGVSVGILGTLSCKEAPRDPIEIFPSHHCFKRRISEPILGGILGALAGALIGRVRWTPVATRP